MCDLFHLPPSPQYSVDNESNVHQKIGHVDLC